MKDMPLRFKLLQADLDASSKSLILSKLDQFQKMPEHSGEYFKLRNWLQSISRIPIGVYKPLPIKKTTEGNYKDAVNFLKDVKKTLDSKVYGHEDSKNQLMRILAQWLSNPESKGNCIGIQGPMGCGKTSLVKEGLCKALGLPFGFISLGGATDSSFLDGHSFTYEGSTYGKIVEILMKTQCMNPIIFFDELDKVSHTYRGEEIIGILTHLTDSSQNEKFNDRYFGEIDLNLSKALFVFSYNDESKINPILKDRMITIRVPGYGTTDKLCIARDYLIPELLKEYKKTKEDIIFTDEIIESIIRKVPREEGVRNLKRGIESIISWLNMHTYIPINSSNVDAVIPAVSKNIQLSDIKSETNKNEILYTFPVTVTEEHIETYIKEDIHDIKNSPAYHMYL
jgi:ATP-dependent Lon protease